MSKTSTLGRRLIAPAAGLSLALASLLALAGPASADANIQIAGPTSPVPVNTSYTYTVTVPPVDNGNAFIVDVTTSLSGAAATFTNVTDTEGLSCFLPSPTQVDCHADHPGFIGPDTITLTVLPTAAGTVTANTTLNATTPGTDSTSTTIGNPTFPFTGFQAPVQNPPTLNQVNAGRAIPMKFSLGGDQGLNIIASGYPTATQINCDTDVPLNPATLTDTAGGSGLQYDPSTGTYTYVWKTSHT